MKSIKPLEILGIVGASGAGKGEQIKLLLKNFPETFYFCVSGTTRPLDSETEVEGKDYYHFSWDRFHEMEDAKMFAETNAYATSHRYGTLKSELEKAKSMGRIALLDIEINGAISIFELYPDTSAFVFLDVSREEALRRFKNPGTRKRENIPERIENIEQQHLIALDHECISRFFLTDGMPVKKLYHRIRDFFQSERDFRLSVKMS